MLRRVLAANPEHGATVGVSSDGVFISPAQILLKLVGEPKVVVIAVCHGPVDEDSVHDITAAIRGRRACVLVVEVNVAAATSIINEDLHGIHADERKRR